VGVREENVLSTDATIQILGFLTFLNIGCMLFVSFVSATIVYSWIRNMQIQRDKLPLMLRDEVNRLATEYVEPLREGDNDFGQPEAQPVKDHSKREILLEDEYSNWKNTD